MLLREHLLFTTFMIKLAWWAKWELYDCRRAAPFKGGLTGAQGTNQLIARTAKAVLAAARHHMITAAEEAAEEAAKLAESQSLSPSQDTALNDDSRSPVVP